MREMSATEASRNFKAVLDEAEHGETITVTRGGKRVAVIAPAPRANGRAVLEVMERYRKRAPAGAADALRRGVSAVDEAASGDLDTDPWTE